MRSLLSAIAILQLCLVALPVLGQDQTATSPQFKRVAAPKPGEPPKIDVQIDPEEYNAYFNPVVPPVQVVAPGANIVVPALPYDGFWRKFVSLGQPRDMAMIELALEQDKPTDPSLSSLQDIADKFASEILLSTVGTKVSPALALAVIATESGGNPDAVSNAGAQGLMQLIPATAERFDVANVMEPAENIRGGVAYLDWLMNEFGGNPVHVIAAYNSGENSVKSYDGAPPFAETRAYVPKVLAAWNVAKGLCITPPELISDGCVFRRREDLGEG